VQGSDLVSAGHGGPGRHFKFKLKPKPEPPRHCRLPITGTGTVTVTAVQVQVNFKLNLKKIDTLQVQLSLRSSCHSGSAVTWQPECTGTPLPA